MTAPKTPDEFKQYVKDGRGMTKSVSLDIDRKFPDVFNSIKSRTDACFNFSSSRTILSGGMPIGAIPNSLRSESHTTGQNSGEMTIKQDGNYMLIAEMTGTSKTTSKVVIYGMSLGWNSIFSSVESWARGENAKCP